MNTLQKNNQVKPKREYALDYSNLCGGLNLWDPDFRLKPGESPEMKNLLWRNGMLCSRKGQVYLSDAEPGQGIAAYPRLWHGCIFAHIGQKLYSFSGDRTQGTGDSENEWSVTELCSGLPPVRGTFFTYSDKLYYKTTGVYLEITAEYENDRWSFSAAAVSPYEPVILINASPSTGAGDLYQPENRLSSRKTVWYNAVSGSRNYKLPVVATRVISVEVDGVHMTQGWSYDRQNGKVIFQTAPPVTDPPTNNTVRITYELSNFEAQKSIMDCRYAAVYGGTGELCVIMAGSEDQPNAYFWSGNSNIKMDAGYFPMEQVQLAGSTEERITGFGKQQDNLIIFKEGSVGKTTLGTQLLNDRIFIDLPYIPINASIGCDLPWSIQLVENNLVFANCSGIYMLLDTTSANENNIICISRKINGSPQHPGLLADLVEIDEDLVCSVDDGTHYCLTVNSHTYCWNYELSSWKDPSWFLLTNTNAVAFICEAGEIFHIDSSGRLTALQSACNDYGEPIERLFRFPTMNFGSYDCLKNVNSVIVTLGAYVPEDTELWYLTDYETRKDLTNLQVVEMSSRGEASAPARKGTASYAPSAPSELRNGEVVSGLPIENNSLYNPPLAGRGDRSFAAVGEVETAYAPTAPSELSNEEEKETELKGGEKTVGEVETAYAPVDSRPISTRIPAVFRRRPMCRRVLHFTMKLINSNLNEDFELVGAQVFYNLQGRMR